MGLCSVERETVVLMPKGKSQAMPNYDRGDTWAGLPHSPLSPARTSTFYVLADNDHQTH